MEAQVYLTVAFSSSAFCGLLFLIFYVFFLFHTISSREPENPEEKEIALSLTVWLQLALEPAAEQNKLFSTRLSSGGRVALSSLSPEKEQLPTSPGFPCQGHFIASLDDSGAGWGTGSAALLQDTQREAS